MRLALGFIVAAAGTGLLGSATLPPTAAHSGPLVAGPEGEQSLGQPQASSIVIAGSAAGVAVKEAMPPPPPTRQEVLRDGVLVVVSLPSQQLFVFRDGKLWRSSKVSSGKKGHKTPTGVFPILQKAIHHRSTIYSGAPMPYMQRLTWDGVALHAGHVPGYPASHGCIRLPRAFARDLYQITNFSSTLVIVTQQPVASAEAALLIR